MLNAITRENLQARRRAHRNVYDHSPGGRPQYFLHPFVEAEAFRGLIEARFGG